MKDSKYLKKLEKQQLGKMIRINNCKDGWFLEYSETYGFPTKEQCYVFADFIGLKLRPPIVDEIGNIIITS